MATVTYQDGIAILQLITFPIFLVVALGIWRRVGWKAGAKSWRFIVTLSVLRIAGSICTLLTINYDNENIYIAEAVCELIGLAPLILTFLGLLGQIDTGNLFHPRFIGLVNVVGLLALILAIVGVSITDDVSPWRPNDEVKAAMGLFLALFVVVTLMSAWLALQLRLVMKDWQKKLFFAIALSWPFVLVRLIYSSVGDYGNDSTFDIFGGSTTAYLCMDVLEEIIAVAIVVVFGALAFKEKPTTKTDAGMVSRGYSGTEQV